MSRIIFTLESPSACEAQPWIPTDGLDQATGETRMAWWSMERKPLPSIRTTVEQRSASTRSSSLTLDTQRNDERVMVFSDYQMPELPPAMHSEASRAFEHTSHWIRRFNLSPHDPLLKWQQRARFDLLAARCFPDASFDALCIASDLFTWLFLVDDLCDRASVQDQIGMIRELIDSLKATTNHAPQPSTQYESISCFIASLKDIMERLDAIDSPGWQVRLRKQMTEYFDEANWELGNQLRHHTPTETEYLKKRSLCGFAIMFSLEGIFDHIDIEVLGEQSKSQMVADLEYNANMAACMANDMHSFGLERQPKVIGLNLVLILQKELGVSLDDALRKVARRHDLCLHFFESNRHLLPSLGSQGLVSYFHGIARIVRGYYDWALIDSQRYRESRPSGFEMESTRIETSPVFRAEQTL